VRADLACPGYPDPTRTIFRDQTHFVIQKANPRARPKSRKGQVAPSPTYLPPLEVSYISRPLLPALESIAKTRFVQHYVLGPERAACPLAYMRVFYPPRPGPSSLEAAIRAASIAFILSSSPMSTLSAAEALCHARKNYSNALTLTNQTLESPDLATHDATLLTVFVLDLFE
jgi:hypothetical protein